MMLLHDAAGTPSDRRSPITSKCVGNACSIHAALVFGATLVTAALPLHETIPLWRSAINTLSSLKARSEVTSRDLAEVLHFDVLPASRCTRKLRTRASRACGRQTCAKKLEIVLA